MSKQALHRSPAQLPQGRGATPGRAGLGHTDPEREAMSNHVAPSVSVAEANRAGNAFSGRLRIPALAPSGSRLLLRPLVALRIVFLRQPETTACTEAETT